MTVPFEGLASLDDVRAVMAADMATPLEACIGETFAAAYVAHLNDHLAALIIPADYRIEMVDLRPPIEPTPTWAITVATLPSAIQYLRKHGGSQTVGYLRDATGRGAHMLIHEAAIADFVIDGHRGTHRLNLLARPTPAARAWAGAIYTTLDRESMKHLLTVDNISGQDASVVLDYTAPRCMIGVRFVPWVGINTGPIDVTAVITRRPLPVIGDDVADLGYHVTIPDLDHVLTTHIAEDVLPALAHVMTTPPYWV